ncbi:MAG TPA: alpha/beta fold hydrolase [Vicinamibacterales bacterium]|nr:alpha/beta fold hydrolase [Vicinamibacterales bacterium]
MVSTRNCTALLLCALLTVAVSGQTPATPQSEGRAEFLIFAGGRQVGREQVNVARSGGNWIITATGSISAPADINVKRFEVKYASDWQPLELHIEATLSGKPLTLSTSFGVTTAVNEITQAGTTNSKTDQISARSIVLPNNFFAAYEAMAARLATANPGTQLPVYVAPQAEIMAVVKVVSNEQLKSPAGTLALRKFQIVFQNPDGPLSADVTIDASNRLARVDIAAAGLSVVRSDLATVSSRPQVSRNPTDTDVAIPALGFTLAGTITTPPQVAGRLRHPAIVLVAGSGRVDREANVAGVPIFTQLAGALAERGFVVLRYDKRAVGQSGGRDERATIQDYAEDLIAAVKWLRKRKDVDRERIAVAGHSEGGAVAMIAAGKEDEIGSLVLIAAPGTRGSDLILEQQQHGLDLLDASAADRKTKVDIQQRIQTAVLTGVGWEGLPPEYRKVADTQWFRSFLQYDPAKVMERVRQPVLIIQGDLDRQVFPHHADKLAELARARKRQAPVELLHVPGVNHLLVPATTGEVAEYATLEDKKVASEIPAKIAEFLNAKGN